MPPADKPSGAGVKTVATHRRAFRDYNILERFEAGIELLGAEVKSIRENRFSLNEAHARIDNGQIYLHGLHVQPYAHARVEDHNPLRRKRLLMHRAEINRLYGQMTVKGKTLIPLKVYLKRGLVKVEVALCTGKQSEDKRETLRRKTADREAQRAIASHTRGR
jgi:SsrA-binding protein